MNLVHEAFDVLHFTEGRVGDLGEGGGAGGGGGGERREGWSGVLLLPIGHSVRFPFVAQAPPSAHSLPFPWSMAPPQAVPRHWECCSERHV